MENKKHMPNSRRSVAHKNVIECRKFRKMGEIMAVVKQDNRVLFGFDTFGHVVVPRPLRLDFYKYETLRKRLSEGKSWWEEEISKIIGGEGQ